MDWDFGSLGRLCPRRLDAKRLCEEVAAQDPHPVGLGCAGRVEARVGRRGVRGGGARAREACGVSGEPSHHPGAFHPSPWAVAVQGSAHGGERGRGVEDRREESRVPRSGLREHGAERTEQRARRRAQHKESRAYRRAVIAASREDEIGPNGGAGDRADARLQRVCACGP